jgi:hypothetical protein
MNHPVVLIVYFIGSADAKFVLTCCHCFMLTFVSYITMLLQLEFRDTCTVKSLNNEIYRTKIVGLLSGVT